jgi:hypothetical protein
MRSLTKLRSRSAASASVESIGFLRLRWTGCVLKDPANTHWHLLSRSSCSVSSPDACATSANPWISEPNCLASDTFGRSSLAFCLEMDEINNENELGRRAEVVTTAAHLRDLRCSPPISAEESGARCPGTNHTLELKSKKNLFYCGCCRAGGGIDELVEFVARKRRTAAGFTGRRIA